MSDPQNSKKTTPASALLVFLLSAPFVFGGYFFLFRGSAFGPDMRAALAFAGIAGAVGMVWSTSISIRDLWRRPRFWIDGALLLLALGCILAPLLISWRDVLKAGGGARDYFIFSSGLALVPVLLALAAVVLVVWRWRPRPLLRWVARGVAVCTTLLLFTLSLYLYCAIVECGMFGGVPPPHRRSPTWQRAVCEGTPNMLREAVLQHWLQAQTDSGRWLAYAISVSRISTVRRLPMSRRQRFSKVT
jgi:hypothetical protein